MDLQIIEIPGEKLKMLPERIAKKAHQLFLRYGIKAITMDDIAVSLSMSKKNHLQVFP